MNYLLATATGEAFCRSQGFAIFIDSLKNVQAQKTIFTAEMPQEIREHLQQEQIGVVDCYLPNIARDRFLAYWRYLQDKDGLVLCADSKDVIFQRDPFEFLSQYKNNLVFVDEGMLQENSPWNWTEQQMTQLNVKEFKSEWSKWPVINSGVIGGNRSLLYPLLLLLWTNTLKLITNTTDQGVLNYLVSFLKEESTTIISKPQAEPYCLTGEAVKQGFVKAIFEDGKFKNLAGETYFIVHQWDRTEAAPQILQFKAR